MGKTIFTFSPREQQQFQQFSVGVLVLFGSQAQGTAGPMSDFDIGVVMKKEKNIFASSKKSDV